MANDQDMAGLSEDVRAALAWLKSGVRPRTRSFDAWQTIRAELLRLVQKAAWLEKQNVEMSMNAYQWMARHDRISAGKDGGDFPRPADVPDAIIRAERAEAELAELRDEIGTKVPAIMWQHAEAELATARETIKRLNRRVQVAEAGVAEKVKASAQGSFGRALANAASEMFMHERDEARADLAALKRMIAEAPVYKCDADVISGRDYDYISAVLIHDDPGFQYPDVDGKRVALLPVGGEHGMTEAAGE